jgi:hypothetical protein
LVHETTRPATRRKPAPLEAATTTRVVDGPPCTAGVGAFVFEAAIGFALGDMVGTFTVVVFVVGLVVLSGVGCKDEAVVDGVVDGATEGLVLGDADGVVVGALEGLAVGALEGLAVGAFDGFVVATLVGAFVGPFDEAGAAHAPVPASQTPDAQVPRWLGLENIAAQHILLEPQLDEPEEQSVVRPAHVSPSGMKSPNDSPTTMSARSSVNTSKLGMLPNIRFPVTYSPK